MKRLPKVVLQAKALAQVALLFSSNTVRAVEVGPRLLTVVYPRYARRKRPLYASLHISSVCEKARACYRQWQGSEARGCFTKQRRKFGPDFRDEALKLSPYAIYSKWQQV